MEKFNATQLIVLILISTICVTWLIFFVVKVAKANVTIGSLLKVMADDSKRSTPIEHRDYYDYVRIVWEFLLQMKDVFRTACLHNGFYDKEGEDLNAYLDTKIEQFQSRFYQFMLDNYFGERIVKLEDFMENIDRELFIETKELITKMFIDVRAIALRKRNEVSAMKQKRRDFIDAEIKSLSDICRKTSDCPGLDGQRISRFVDIASIQYSDISEELWRNTLGEQMEKVQEYLLDIKSVMLARFHKILAKKIKGEKK